VTDFLQTVRERVVIYDGAMGTNIQLRQPTLDDFWGKENCSEVLVLSRPDIIQGVHASFLEVGCDVVETNTFGGTRIVLGEFDLADRVRDINLAAVKLARDAAQQFSTKDKPRFVAGSIGPTTKLPSLGHITFDDMVAAYEEQAAALIEGGVDILLVETCQDLLQAKIATVGVIEAMRKAGKRLPVQVQVTLQESGTMLLGTAIGAALTTLEPYDIDAIGLNCATGPAEMNEAVRYLCLNSTKHVSVLPNAGLPRNEGGHAVYKLTPEELAKYHRHFVADYGVRIIGGCCGTRPEHLKAVVEAVSGVEPAKREVKAVGGASSAYTAVPLDLEPKPLIVAEEMNTTTRVEHFRNLVRAKKYGDILSLAKKLVNEGAHMLDLCCAIVGEDEKGCISAILEKIASRVPAPILIDSTEADVIEEALKRIPGKAIINSINLEDGEKRTAKVLPMAKRYGAAVIALTIDEEGMALTADKKVAIARRIFDLATKKYGIRPVDLILDALTLPISTGQEDYRTAGIETLNAVKRIKQELPEVKTVLGVSNISFGLDVYPRRVLNSVFLYEAVENGLDIAIVNYTKIYPLYKIPQEEVELARRLIYRESLNGDRNGDPLQAYMQHFAGMQGKEPARFSPERSAAVTDTPNIPQPPFWGTRVIKGEGQDFSRADKGGEKEGALAPVVGTYDLREIFNYINDTALFKNQWQLKTASQEDYARLVEEKYRPIKKQLQEEVIASGLFAPKVVYGYFPAQAEGNDVIVYSVPSSQFSVLREDQRPLKELLRFTFPRQKEGRKLSIADFFARANSGNMDVLGLSLVTIGSRATAETQRLFKAGEYTRCLYLHGLSVETAEALAEFHHKKMREELGIAGNDSPHIRDLFHQKYRGSRYSFGYPACPNLEDQAKLFKLLAPEKNVGVRLTSGFLLEPEQSTSAIVVHHPAARYFVV